MEALTGPNRSQTLFFYLCIPRLGSSQGAGGVGNRDPVGASWLEKDSTKTIAGGIGTDLAGLRWIVESEARFGTGKLLQTVEGSLLSISPLPSTVGFQQESQRSGDGGHLGQEFSQERVGVGLNLTSDTMF